MPIESGLEVGSAAFAYLGSKLQAAPKMGKNIVPVSSTHFSLCVTFHSETRAVGFQRSMSAGQP